MLDLTDSWGALAAINVRGFFLHQYDVLQLHKHLLTLLVIIACDMCFFIKMDFDL